MHDKNGASRTRSVGRGVAALVPCLLVGCVTTQLGSQELAFEKYTLDNGLTVILHEDHRLPLVAVNLWYRVGSKDETAGRSGFAHLFEHLMFMGTKAVGEGEFDRIMERHGASNNATTSMDRTNYFEAGPSTMLEMFLYLESDRLRTLGGDITQEKLDLQRDVVRNERRQSYENRPYGKSFLAIWPQLYPAGHPYHDPVIGSHEDLESAGLDDVKTFFATFYVPCNAALVVAGDFEPAQAREWIEKHFGSIPRGEIPRHAKAQPAALTESKTVTLVDRVELSRTTMIWHSPAFYAPGDADLDVLSPILDAEKTGRLYQRLVYEKGLAQDVSAGQWSAHLGSLYMIEATARPNVSLDVIEKEIDAVLAELVTRPPTQRECDRARNGIETLFWHELESVAGRADLLNRYEFNFGDPGALARDLARYEAVTPESVLEWARKTLKTNARVVIRTVPAAAPQAAPSDESQPRAEESR